MLKIISLSVIIFCFTSPTLAFANDSIPFAKEPDKSNHHNIDLNYSSGQSNYATMPDGEVRKFRSPNKNTAEGLSLTLSNIDETNLLIGGSINLFRTNFENSNAAKDFIHLNFVSLNVMTKWFPFSKTPRWFYLLGGFGFTGSKGKASVNNLEYDLKGFGADFLLGAGVAIPVTSWFNINLGVQAQANIVTDMLVPYLGAGYPLLNAGFGISF